MGLRAPNHLDRKHQCKLLYKHKTYRIIAQWQNVIQFLYINMYLSYRRKWNITPIIPKISPVCSINGPLSNQKINDLVDIVNELSNSIESIQDDCESMRENHANALKRITVLEKQISDRSEIITVQSKTQGRGAQIVEYLETHDGITTSAAMQLLKVPHSQSVQRVMKWCAEKDDRLFYTKTATGKRILKIKRRWINSLTT